MSTGVKFVNYQNVISAMPVESHRINTKVKSDRSLYDSEQRGTMDFNIPSLGFLDCNSSYLKTGIKIKQNTVLPTLSALSANYSISVMFDNCPATAWINRASVFSSEGVLITQKNNCNMSVLQELKDYNEETIKKLSRAMGYNQIFEREFQNDVANDANRNYRQIIAAQHYADTLAGIAGETFPCALRYPAGSVDPMNNNVPFYSDNDSSELESELCIPLKFLSGIFSTPYLLPTQFMGSKSHALNIKLEMESAENCILITACHTNALSTGAELQVELNKLKPENKPQYQLINPELVLEYVSLGAESTENVKQAIYNPNSDGLKLHFVDYSSTLDVGKSSTDYVFSTNKTCMSLKSMKAVAKRSSSNVSRYQQAYLSQGCRAGVTEAWARFSGSNYPNEPIRYPLGAGKEQCIGAGYFEATKTASSLVNKSGLGHHPFYSLQDGSGFSVAIDFDKKEVDNDVYENDRAPMSGKNLTSNGYIELQLKRDTSDSAKPIDVFYTFQSDNFLLIKDGIVSTYEARA